MLGDYCLSVFRCIARMEWYLETECVQEQYSRTELYSRTHAEW